MSESKKEHIKHPPLLKPLGGKFHRNELSILGAPCGQIQALSKTIADALKSEMRVSYVDADHGDGAEENVFFKTYTDKISRHSIEFDHLNLDYKFRNIFNDSDAVLINGNHFAANQQVVIIHPSKEDSLRRKLEKLSDVKLFILAKDSEAVFPFIYEKYPHYAEVPILLESETESIIKKINTLFKTPAAAINGLIFAGGKSTRMGRDKGEMLYHNKPQREHMADLLSEFCDKVYISTAADSNIKTEYTIIEDTFTGLGPYGGILSAFRTDPNTAWFTVACDIPLLDRQTLAELVNSRDPSKMATCFHNPATEFPEPLITIWEPRAYQDLLHFLSIGYSCPRKALINSDINEIQISDAQKLINANTPEDLEKVQSLINS